MKFTHGFTAKAICKSFAFCVSVYASTACSSITQHENFAQHMQANVGKVFSGNNLNWMEANRFVASRVLSDGKVEREYIFCRSCRYFFKIEPTTSIVVAWRYEGSDEDCSIPN